MKIVIDNQIVKILAHDATEMVKNPFLSDLDNRISFRWPSLLEYLGCGTLFSTLPAFDQSNPFFVASVATLCGSEEKEVILYMYDRLFAENLIQIKALPQINAAFLIQAIKEQRQKDSFLQVEKLLSPVLAAYEAAFVENEANTMHDLILYLAWDRMCVCIAQLFDYQSSDPKFINGIGVLKECLIESYQYITQHERTAPGIFRMLEALLFYQMREENLQKHTAEEWALLSQSFRILKSQDELIDCFYIDDALKPDGDAQCYLTLDSPETVDSRLSFAQFMINKIKSESPQWNYILYRSKKSA